MLKGTRTLVNAKKGSKKYMPLWVELEESPAE